MPATAKELFIKEIETMRDAYASDLEAMSQEELAKSPGGSARSPFDFTYEVIWVNNRVATRLRGETPPQAADDGWMKAPAAFCDKENAILQFRASIQEILKALDRLEETDMLKPIVLANGTETCALKLCHFACLHTAYHDAQMNYLQSLYGDEKVHW